MSYEERSDILGSEWEYSYPDGLRVCAIYPYGLRPQNTHILMVCATSLWCAQWLEDFSSIYLRVHNVSCAMDGTPTALRIREVQNPADFWLFLHSWQGAGNIGNPQRNKLESALRKSFWTPITINVPLFKKLRDIIFFLRDNNFLSRFEGHFEGAKTFLTP